MIIADDFVFLHPPKTGGSFVTEVLEQTYAAQWGHSIVNMDKHGGVERVPTEHRSKQLITIVRNPFDYYASHYQFGYWIGRQTGSWLGLWNDGEIAARFAGYPYLTFAEFIEAALDFGLKHLPLNQQSLANTLHIGPLTVRMLQFSVDDYIGLLENLAATGETGLLKHEIAKVKFLHTESLNVEVHRWMIELGVPDDIAGPVLSKSKIQPLNTPDGVVLARGHGQPRCAQTPALFDERTRAKVVEREWLFFTLFPEYRHLLEPGDAT